MMSGWKTYAIGFLMIVLAGLNAQGYLPDDTFRWLEGLLMGGGFMTLRAGVKSVSK